MGDVRLRPHHLLCLQGFRGQGYSPSFIANMARLIDRLVSETGLKVRIVNGADDVCTACPHLDAGVCARPEQDVDDLDREVMRRLGLTAGHKSSWHELVGVVASRIGLEDFHSICSDCRWTDFDYCESGIEALADDHRRKQGRARPAAD